jgi:hypothetical protein
VAWALDVLGFPPGDRRSGQRDVLAQYRTRPMEVHPDHGGDEIAASGHRRPRRGPPHPAPGLKSS